MNRRSFLGLLPLAPVVGPALAKEAAMSGAYSTDTLRSIFTELDGNSNYLIDSTALERAVAELRQLPAVSRISATEADHLAGSAEREADALENIYDQPPDDIWPI